MAEVSVVMPMHNPSELADRAVESVLNQTFDDFEVVIVDDGSDGEIKYRWQNDKIRYIRHEYNKGLACARNTGIVESNGKFIAFLDHDDYWQETKLEKQLELFENGGEELGAVFTGDRFVHGGDIINVREPSPVSYPRLLKNNSVPLSGSSIMVKRRVFDDVGLFDGRMAGVEDWDMWLRITKNYEIDYVDEILVTQHKSMDWKPWWGNVGGRMAIIERYGDKMPFFDRQKNKIKLLIDSLRLIF